MTASNALKYWFAKARIRNTIIRVIGPKSGRGIDRMTPKQLVENVDSHVETIHRKVVAGSYSFAPYVELLRPRGPSRPPRVISFPTARDRVVLHLLKEVLHSTFPEFISRSLPNVVVRHAATALQTASETSDEVFRTDISNFCPSIDHKVLFTLLQRRIRSKAVLSLIRRAIANRTVPVNYRKSDYKSGLSHVGIPQGLPISNILANVYMGQLDAVLETHPVTYIRYVDDILVVGSWIQVVEAADAMVRKASSLGLTISPGKTSFHGPDSMVDFLGYRFCMPLVSVRPAAAERLLAQIATFATAFKYNLDTLARTSSATRTELVDSFYEDVNEKITGAIREHKRYGWIFYYLEITDLTLLFRLDSAIAAIVHRFRNYIGNSTGRIKHISRAYYEAKHRPGAGYIHDYGQFADFKSKQQYLKVRGVFQKDQTYRSDQIDSLFERRVRQNLDRLETDTGIFS